MISSLKNAQFVLTFFRQATPTTKSKIASTSSIKVASRSGSTTVEPVHYAELASFPKGGVVIVYQNDLFDIIMYKSLAAKFEVKTAEHYPKGSKGRERTGCFKVEAVNFCLAEH